MEWRLSQNAPVGIHDLRSTVGIGAHERHTVFRRAKGQIRGMDQMENAACHEGVMVREGHNLSAALHHAARYFREAAIETDFQARFAGRGLESPYVLARHHDTTFVAKQMD